MISDFITGGALRLIEAGYMPDTITRWGIRRLCTRRKQQLASQSAGDSQAATARFVEHMNQSPIAPVPDKANDQHYEVPAAFYELVLGPHRKYSCAYWPSGVDTLAEAERAALDATCEHANLSDGHDILELGCGWGSLTLFMARRYPHSRITAVSNSSSQRAFIESQAASNGLNNIEIITADMNTFDIDRTFDRIVSVEMFEHMRNYRALLRRARRWLRADGQLFLHIFCHREIPYAFETDGQHNWMGRHFFTGGIMPSESLLKEFDEDFSVAQQWRWNGQNYQRTAEAWLENIDRHREKVFALFRDTYGPREAHRWFNRWRIFFMACAELFDYDHGQEWFVTHQRLVPTTRTVALSTSPEMAYAQ